MKQSVSQPITSRAIRSPGCSDTEFKHIVWDTLGGCRDSVTKTAKVEVESGLVFRPCLAETPCLYTLVVRAVTPAGRPLQHEGVPLDLAPDVEACRVGIRDVCVSGKRLRVNGVPVIIQGGPVQVESLDS